MKLLRSLGHAVTRAQRRHASTKNYISRLQSGVYISTSEDIYENLALEDWIYENTDMHDKAILLMWRNAPAVVIGRHQNTWAEVNVRAARARDVPIVRRKSGGGTVYHDLGNLNLSVISARKAYDRKCNLELLAGALRQHWDLGVTVTERDDVILDDKFKISGTAAKLGVKAAYHHFTLLLNVQTTALYSLLRPDVKGIQTKATESVRVTVKNLQEVNPSVTHEGVMAAMAQAYARQVLHSDTIQPIFLDPRDMTQFPGVAEIVTELKTWEWTFAKTPKFKTERGFIEFIEGIGFQDVDITIEVTKGCISEIVFKSKSLSNIDEIGSYFNAKLCGVKYELGLVTEKLQQSNSCNTDIEVTGLVKQWLKGLLLKHMIGNS